MNFSSHRVNFVPLPAWIYGRSTPDEKAVLGALQYHFPNIEPSIDRIVELSGVSKSSVLRVIQKLEQKGWITVVRTPKTEGKKARNQYTLNIFSSIIEDFRGVRVALPENPEVSGWHYQKCQNTGVRGSKTDPVRGVTVAPKLNRTKLNKEELKQGTKQVTSKKALSLQDPPLSPPMGGATGMVDPWLENFEPCKSVAENQPVEKLQAPPQAQPLLEAAKIPEQAPAPDPIAVEPEVPTSKPRTRKRAIPFAASVELIPAALLPVKGELMNFWRAKRGEKSEGAWKALIRNAGKIQADADRGGTETVRWQLVKAESGRWMGLDYTRWIEFGRQQHPQAHGSTGVSANQAPWRDRSLTGCELTRAAMALSGARDALRARRHGEAPQQASGAILGASHGVIDVEVVA